MRIIGKDRAYVVGAHCAGGRVAKVEHRSLALLRGRPVADVVAWAARWGVTVELSADERTQLAAHAGDRAIEVEQATGADR